MKYEASVGAYSQMDVTKHLTLQYRCYRDLVHVAKYVIRLLQCSAVFQTIITEE